MTRARKSLGRALASGIAVALIMLGACRGAEERVESARDDRIPQASPTTEAAGVTARSSAVSARYTSKGPTDVALPANYQTEFTNYLSIDRLQHPDQIIRLFANEEAMRGPDAEGKLPFGSVIVGEVYKARLDADGEVVVSQLGRRIRDKLVLIAVMERGEHLGREHPPGLKNGHWEFAAYKPDGSVAAKDLNSCRACHAPLKNTNHLFSLEHLIAQN